MQKVVKKVQKICFVSTPISDAEDIVKDLKTISQLNRMKSRDLMRRDNQFYMVKYRDDEKYGDSNWKMDKPPSVLSDIVSFCKKRTEDFEDLAYMLTFVESGPRATFSVPVPDRNSINRYIFNFCYNELYELEKDTETSESNKVFMKHLNFDPTMINNAYVPANHFLEMEAGVLFDYIVNVRANHSPNYVNPSNPLKTIPFKRFPGYKMCVIVDIIDRTNTVADMSSSIIDKISNMSKEEIHNAAHEMHGEAPNTKHEKEQKEKSVEDLMT